MNLVYFMQAFEKLKLFYLFSPNHYVIVLQYSFLLIYIFFIFAKGMNTRIHAAGILISNSSFYFCFS